MFHKGIILIIILNISLIFIAKCFSHIQKRTILFADTFVLQLTCCIAVPGTLPNRTLALNLCVQANFNAISKVSQLTPTVIKARTIPEPIYDITRVRFYEYIENILENYIENGKECLLKSICETTEIPFDKSSKYNLLSKIFHFIFTPSFTETENISKYIDAERTGNTNANCSVQYQNCKTSVLSIFSLIF